jgi:hypothetical protein
MLRRALIITLGLVAAGALVGALCGIIALVPIPILHWLRPSPDDGFVSAKELAPYAATAGAAIGAVLGPALAWGLLRHVALWRVVVMPLIGTLFGVIMGWFVARNAWIPGIPAIIGTAMLGLIAGALVLRWSTRSTVHVSDAPT